VKPDGTAATGNVIRATVTSKLNAALIVGDFYRHTVKSLTVTSAQNSPIITDANKELTAVTTATIELMNNEEDTQAQYFAEVLGDPSVHLYHSFNLQMIRSDTSSTKSDIIQGIDQNNITARYSLNGGESVTVNGDDIIRESNYIQCTTGDIKSYLINKNNGFKVTIVGTAVMDFSNYSDEFPPNPNELDQIGVRGAVRSNIAYQESDLPYSKMNATHDPVRPYYYTKEDNSALFSFDAIDELDEEEIGTNTKNNSRLGVNNYFIYNNLIHGKSVYNAMDVKDYAYSGSIEYTLELYRKTTDENSVTSYQQVNMTDYLSNIELIDTEIPSGEGGLLKTEKTKTVTKTVNGEDLTENLTYYVFTRNLKMNDIDKDALFYTDFTCNVLKDESFSQKEYANYKIQLTVHLNGSTNNERTSYIIYTHAKIDPTMIEEN